MDSCDPGPCMPGEWLTPEELSDLLAKAGVKTDTATPTWILAFGRVDILGAWRCGSCDSLHVNVDTAETRENRRRAAWATLRSWPAPQTH